MINYKYDFELYTLNELPTNDARLFLNIIVSNALTKAQAIQYKNNTVWHRQVKYRISERILS